MNNTNLSDNTILIIDDAPENVEFLRVVLDNTGFQVLVAKNGQEGIQQTQTVRPDLILLDVLMPDIDGFEVCRRLKSQEDTQAIPVIFMTALNDTVNKIKGFEVGAADYVTKPFQYKEVLARIHAQITIYQQKQQLVQKNLQLQQEIVIRKQAETALQEQEQAISAILNASTDSIALVEQEGTCVIINSTGATHLGKTINEIKGQNLYHFLSPTEATRKKALVDEVFLTGKVTILEEGKADMWFESHYYPVFNQDNVVTRVAIVAHNISKRKQTEEALRASETLLAQAQSIAHFGNCERNLITNELRWSEETFRIFGLSPQKTFLEVSIIEKAIHPDDWESVKQAILQAIHQNKPYQPEYRIIRTDGSIRHIQALGNLVRNEEGKPLYLRGTVQDITKRKQAELKLQQNKLALEQANIELNRFKNTLDMTLDCVFMLEVDSLRIFYANQGAVRLLGYRQETLLQMVLPEIDDLFISEPHRPLLESLLENEKPALTFESIYRHKNTTLIPVEIFVQCIRLSNHPTHFVAIVRNITERKQVEAKLQQAKEAAEKANRAKSAFLANMSHELRTPLNAILGYTQIFKRDQSLNIEQQKGVDIIHRNGEYLLTLINDILDLSKIEAGKLDIYLTDFHFGDFLKGITELFRMRAEQNQISFHYNQLTELPRIIHTDEKRLRQILLNLLSNAIKFTEQGSVTLKVSSIAKEPSNSSKKEQGGISQIRFRVEDTGVGIAPPLLKKIFLPFEQVGDSNVKASGTGLGLSITKKLVDMMGGEIHVESTLGQGSTFWVILDLPIVSKVMLPLQTEQPIIIGFEGESRRILVVDDTWENCLVLMNLLKPLGFTVNAAHNGFEAVKKTREWQPDIILMDLVMPDMDGFETTRQLRQIPTLTDIVIIAISASAFNWHQQKSLEVGCNDFIAKPICAEELLEKLQKHLKLTYIYDENNHSQLPVNKKVVNQPETLFSKPTPEQAMTLFRLTLRGDINGITTYLKQLEQTDKQLAPFIQQISQLTNQFAIKQIRKIAKQYLENN